MQPTAMPAPREKWACVWATSGPGATNLVTGIATAYMDSIPMVAITANVAVNLLGKDTLSGSGYCRCHHASDKT